MIDAFQNDPCPYLPAVERVWKSADISSLGEDRGPRFYHASLQYAQSQWRCGLPGQALLQINRSLVCYLTTEEMSWPLAYRAVAWLLAQRSDAQFIGNPRRHFQHLATRMVEPHKELRTWRAWACWDLARSMLPEAAFPADMKQIRSEGVVEPTRERIREKLNQLSPADDVARWEEALELAASEGWADLRPTQPDTAPRIEVIDAAQLHLVRELAERIWPTVYPTIITQEQIRYMLDLMYSPAALNRDISEHGVTFALIHDGDALVGCMGCGPEDGAFHLHKLYLLPTSAGRGIGAVALTWVMERALRTGFTSVKLRVNKHNHKAIRAYLRSGFTFEKDVVADIGGGFVMDDYVMVRHLTP
jgi:GNAT superfamily N-acetyltransferase